MSYRPPGRRSKPARTQAQPTLTDRLSSQRLRRNVWVAGRRTSVSLEIAVWDALGEICEREHHPMDRLCSLVDERRRRASLASSLRVFALAYFRAIADRHKRRRPRRGDSTDEPSMLALALARFPRRRPRSGDDEGR